MDISGHRPRAPKRTKDDYPYFMPERLRYSFDQFRGIGSTAFTKQKYYRDILSYNYSNREELIRDEFADGHNNQKLDFLEDTLKDFIAVLDWVGREDILHERAQKRADDTAYWQDFREGSAKKKDKPRQQVSISDRGLKKACRRLGVWPGADRDVVRKEYTKRLRSQHPDMHSAPKAKRDAEVKTRTLIWAWERLQAEYGWE